jgi:PAS domain S-box-containing protein
MQESEFLLGIFNSIPNPIFVLDKKGYIIQANHCFCHITGIPSGKITGMNIDRVFAPEVSELFVGNNGDLNNREIILESPGGGTNPYLVSVLKAGFAKGRFSLYSLRDLSDDKRTEESLLESEFLYKTLVNQLPNPILIHIGGQVVFANDMTLEITGYDKDGIIGRNVEDLLTDPLDPDNREVFSNLNGDSFAEESEFEIRSENRKVIIKSFLLRNSRIKYKGKDAVMTILVDITERKHLEKYILSMVMATEEKDRKQFAADLHDDLGPILSSIKLHLGLLEQAKDREKFNETLAICNRQLGEAISKMRIISNNLMPRLIENFGLEAAASSFINTMQHEGVFAIRFDSNLKGRRFPGQTELHFYRILCELINNTIKHAGASEAVVKLKYRSRILALDYTDNGKGYRVDEINPRTAGLGVGNIIRRANLIDAVIRFEYKKGKTLVAIRKEL